DYVRELYLPAAAHAAVLGADGHRGARELAAYRARLDSCWHQVHIDAVDVSDAIADLGDVRRVDAVVALGDLRPDEVEVQLVVGRVGQSGELEDTTVVGMLDEGRTGDDPPHHRFVAEASLDRAGRMGVTVRVVPSHPSVAAPLELGHVAWAD
ncbi:MAG: DUF3417 domain-containing protein, partial [Microthrixaceae bacterium]